MKVRADHDLCMGSGSCAFMAPNTFDVGDDMKVVILDGDDPDSQVLAAVEACPRRALVVTQEEG
jgi:ferredoxin